MSLVGSQSLLGCSASDGTSSHTVEKPLYAGQPSAVDNGQVDPLAEPDPRPDIVVVLADDMRWNLMSGEGNPFLTTPNLDSLANDGAKMNKAFVPVPLCSPSRAALLTGREAHQASAPGINYRNNSFLKTQKTFAQDLQDAGYTTAYIGKWHLGDGATPQTGFDHWESFDWLGDFFNPDVFVNGEEQHFSGYVDDVLSARAAMYLESMSESNKPVFLMVGLKAPHLKFEHPSRYDETFDDVYIPKPDTYDEDFSASGKLQKVKDWLGIDNFHCGLNCFEYSWDTYIKKHYRAVLSLDDSVGTIREAALSREKEDNTLFFFTSDHGYSLGDHGLTEKHMLYEEPLRVPFLVDFPGDDDKGMRFDGMVSTLDIAPTALDYAGVAIPERMTGRSLRPLADSREFDDASPADWREEMFFFYSEWQVAIRTDRYKYIESLQEPGHIELYDLQEDPGERRTVHADPSYASVLEELEVRLNELKIKHQWTPRVRTPLQKVLVSSPVEIQYADATARTVSLGPTPDPEAEPENGLSWRLVTRDGDRFELGRDIPPGHTVLVAIPLERTLDWDPHARIHLGSPWSNALYVDGEPVWDNYEKRPIDFPNPPMKERATLSVLRIDGQGDVTVGIGLEAPGKSMTLPLESRLLE